MNYGIYDRGYIKNTALRREAEEMLKKEAKHKRNVKKHEDELFGFVIISGIALVIALLTKNIMLTGLMALIACLFLTKIDNVFLLIPALLFAWPFVLIPALLESKNTFAKILGYAVIAAISVFLFIALDMYNLIILP